MKRFRMMLVIVLSTVICTNGAEAHGKYTQRKRCGWAARHKVKARVNRYLVTAGGFDKSCREKPYLYAYAVNECAYQEVIYDKGHVTMNGDVHKDDKICGRGFPNSVMFYDLRIPKTSDRSPSYESTSIGYESIDFREDRVVLPNLNGEMYVAGRNMFSSLEVIVWKPRHDYVNGIEDTVADASEYLWYGKIELLNGSVNVTGDFPEAAYRLVGDEKGGYSVLFDNATITALLPEGTDTQADEIVVEVTSDGGTKESKVIKEIVEQTERDRSIAFNIYPNPSADLFTIDFNTEVEETGSVRMYDQQGRLIETIFEGAFERENRFEVDLHQTELSPGTYPILIQSDNQQYIKRLVVK